MEEKSQVEESSRAALRREEDGVVAPESVAADPRVSPETGVPPFGPDDPFVSVHKGADPLEADLLLDLLRQSGLTARKVGTHHAAGAGLGQLVIPIWIEVPRPQAKLAAELLNTHSAVEVRQPERHVALHVADGPIDAALIEELIDQRLDVRVVLEVGESQLERARRVLGAYRKREEKG